jgi:predicted PurR-regulated permease PerM/GAF domain-containing protein
MPTEQPLTSEQPEPVGDSLSALGLPGLRFVVGSSAIALAIAALHYGAELLQPLVIAALLAFVLAPLVKQLRRWRLGNGLAVGVVVTGMAAALGLATVMMGQQVAQLSRDLPSYQETVRAKLHALRPLQPTLQQHGVLGDALRLLGVVEGELDAARRAFSPPPDKPVQRVQVEAAPLPPLQALAQLAGIALMPLAQIGLTLVLIVGMLLQRHEMRDRLLRLLGTELHPMADALNEAGRRVSRYLLAQLLVNLAYGLPLALGLWALGVPGAWLWGLLGVLLRFVPYLGPVVAGALPLLLAFAVDPGWSLVLKTAALVTVLELLLNNVVEPLAYGRSTGVSPLAVLLSAGFWSLVWGPIGLVLATPITVCLLVLGRHLGPLRLLEHMLSSKPVFDPATRLHQRLISGDIEEALQLCHEAASRDGLAAAYDRLAIPALGLATGGGSSSMTAAHRHHLVSGMTRVLQALRDDYPSTAPAGAPLLLCIGARSEFDTLSAEMLAQTLQHEGLAARFAPANVLAAERIHELALQGVGAVCVCSFSLAPATHTRYVARRLQRLRPGLPLLLAAWQVHAPDELSEADTPLEGLSEQAWTLATSLDEALRRVKAWAKAWSPQGIAGDDDALTGGHAEPNGLKAQNAPSAPTPPGLDDAQTPQALLARSAQRLLDVFGSPTASATALLRLPTGRLLQASAGLPVASLSDATQLLADAAPLREVMDEGLTLAVPDLARDARYSRHGPLLTAGLQSLVAVPLALPGQPPQGLLALHDSRTRAFNAEELRLLQQMASELAAELEANAQVVAPVSLASHLRSPAAAGHRGPGLPGHGR